jgi:hypothetical protein
VKQLTEKGRAGFDGEQDARTIAVLEAQAGRGTAGVLVVRPQIEVTIPDTPYIVWHDLPTSVAIYYAVTHPDSDTNVLWTWAGDIDDPDLYWLGVEESTDDAEEGWSVQARPIDDVNSPTLKVWRPATQ